MTSFLEPVGFDEEDDESTEGYVGTVDYDVPESEDD
jgi:hypothetical protein